MGKFRKADEKILDDAGVNYYEAVGEAAFYGPKLDVQSVNVYGKEDTLFTIQIDFELAERFDMSYVDADGNKKTVYRTSQFNRLLRKDACAAH